MAGNVPILQAIMEQLFDQNPGQPVPEWPFLFPLWPINLVREDIFVADHVINQEILLLIIADVRFDTVRNLVCLFPMQPNLTPFQRMLKALVVCLARSNRRGVVFNLISAWGVAMNQPVVPEFVSQIPLAHFEAWGITRGRAQTIVDFCQLFNDQMQEWGDEEFITEITQLGGVGYYSGFRINLFARGRIDFLPSTLPFRRALQWFNDLPATPTWIQTQHISQIWNGRRGLAAYMIWDIHH